MGTEIPAIIPEELAGWTPSEAAQAMVIWRVLHMFLARYGSVPLGQLLVGLTATHLNELGQAPTVTELCEATGLPKSSISRYISAQMEQGVVSETIDPEDRRRRMLDQTEAGRRERRWQIQQMRQILTEVRQWETSQHAPESATALQEMRRAAGEPPSEFGKRRKRGRASVA